jgi:hypothetical protein
LLAVSALAGYLIFWDLSRRGWSAFSGTPMVATAQEAANTD